MLHLANLPHCQKTATRIANIQCPITARILSMSRCNVYRYAVRLAAFVLGSFGFLLSVAAALIHIFHSPTNRVDSFPILPTLQKRKQRLSAVVESVRIDIPMPSPTLRPILVQVPSPPAQLTSHSALQPLPLPSAVQSFPLTPPPSEAEEDLFLENGKRRKRLSKSFSLNRLCRRHSSSHSDIVSSSVEALAESPTHSIFHKRKLPQHSLTDDTTVAKVLLKRSEPKKSPRRTNPYGAPFFSPLPEPSDHIRVVSPSRSDSLPTPLSRRVSFSPTRPGASLELRRAQSFV